MPQYNSNDDILHDVIAQVLPSPFFSSWIGRAREESLTSVDPKKRSAGWANWALGAAAQIESSGQYKSRSYVSLTLDGKFYDPNGRGPVVRPHIEIPANILNQQDAEFPDRLSESGNMLRSPWWVVSEIKAVKRSIFNKPGNSSVAPLLQLLHSRRVGLENGVIQLMEEVSPFWQTIEEELVTSPGSLLDSATATFSSAEISEYFKEASDLNLSITYDQKLLEVSKDWASRRIGVWTITGRDPATSSQFNLGIITPRLTAGSLFKDPMLKPHIESAGALLVRGLILRRLVIRFKPVSYNKHIAPAIVMSPPPTSNSHFRALSLRPGIKTPEASIEAAIHFIQTFKNPKDGWDAISTWARNNGYILTVTQSGFEIAFNAAKRMIRRAEDPLRADIDVVLPLGWDSGRVFRVTFSK